MTRADVLSYRGNGRLRQTKHPAPRPHPTGFILTFTQATLASSKNEIASDFLTALQSRCSLTLRLSYVPGTVGKWRQGCWVGSELTPAIDQGFFILPPQTLARERIPSYSSCLGTVSPVPASSHPPKGLRGESRVPRLALGPAEERSRQRAS